MADAIQAFVSREYPDGRLGGEKLVVIPDLTADLDTLHLYSDQGKLGELLERDKGILSTDLLATPAGQNLHTKYRGEHGEVQVLKPLIKALQKEKATIICSHKTRIDTLEKALRNQLQLDNAPNPAMQLGLKLAEAIGLDLDIKQIKKEVKEFITTHFGQGGNQKVTEMKTWIKRSRANTTLNKWKRMHQDKKLKVLEKMLTQNPSATHIDLTMYSDSLMLAMMKEEINKCCEHDIVMIYPKHKAVVQVEVKAVDSNATNKNKPVEEALKQLGAGLEELARVHSHALDKDWSFHGVIALPNLTEAEKSIVCRNKKICQQCQKFFLTSNMDIPHLLTFLGALTFPDSPTLKHSYKSLVERLAALVYLVPTLPAMERITGQNTPITGGSTKHDFIPELFNNCPLATINKWKKSKHTGSPLSIMFLNRLQLVLWEEQRLLFIGDYGIGKTTLLKSKAISLALAGQDVHFIFIGAMDDWGRVTTLPSVMEVMNKDHLSNIKDASGNTVKMTTVGAQDLQKFYAKNNSGGWFSGHLPPDIHYMLQFYLEQHPGSHIFVDELPVIQTGFQFINMLTSRAKTFCLKRVTVSGSSWWFNCGMISLAATMRYFSWYSDLFLAFGITAPFLVDFVPTLDTFDHKKTASQLCDYSKTLPNQTLWVALHSQYFRESGPKFCTKKELVKDFKMQVLKSFEIPNLDHNMRNVKNINEAAREVGIVTADNSDPKIEIMPAASAPAEDPSEGNPTPLPVSIPLFYYPTQLASAVVHAYRQVLKVLPNKEQDSCVVFLASDAWEMDMVACSLKEDGVPAKDITLYTEAGHLARLKKFLNKPEGVLITTEEAFSGMEARHVVYCTHVGLSGLFRSSLLRAVEQCIVISGSINTRQSFDIYGRCFYTDFMYRNTHIDSKYLTCQNLSKRILICGPSSLHLGVQRICFPCRIICHMDCHNSRSSTAIYNLIIQHIIPSSSCQCKEPNCKKLNPNTMMNLTLRLFIISWLALSLIMDFLDMDYLHMLIWTLVWTMFISLFVLFIKTVDPRMFTLESFK